MVGKRPIKINEKGLREIIKKYILEAISSPPFSSTFRKHRLSELPDIETLTEGLIKSYDLSFVIRYLKEKLNFTTDQNLFSNYQAEGFIFTEDDYDGTCDNINIVVPYSYKRMSDLETIMSACGYTKAHTKKLNDDLFLQIEYEKHFQDEVRGLVGKYKYIYHLTPSVYVNKILKQGLVPRSDNKYLNYAPRIYFLLDKTTINYKDVASMLYNKKLEDNETPKDELEKYKSEYTLLRVKTSNLIGKYKFYMDNNLPNSIYITDNIPPKYIEIDTTGIKVTE